MFPALQTNQEEEEEVFTFHRSEFSVGWTFVFNCKYYLIKEWKYLLDQKYKCMAVLCNILPSVLGEYNCFKCLFYWKYNLTAVQQHEF